MAGRNIFFCSQHTPHIAAQLKTLPRTSRDRRVIEAQIETLSRESLVAADRLLEIMTNWHSAPRSEKRHGQPDEG